MQSESWFYCDQGHVFSWTGNLTLREGTGDPVGVKDCPTQEDHVLYDDGSSTDQVWGPFNSQLDAENIMYQRMRASRSYEFVAPATEQWKERTVVEHFDVVLIGELDEPDRESVVVQTTVVQGVPSHTSIWPQTDKHHGWLRFLADEDRYLRSRGFKLLTNEDLKARY